MRIGRREFLKYCIGSAASLALPLSVLGKLEKAYGADGAGLPRVVWLNGANCTGCTVSLANLVGDQKPVDVADLLVNTIDLAFHPNLMGAAGDLAVDCLHNATKGDFILVVDGGIPTAFGGHTCILWSEKDGREVTAQEAVLTLAPKAAAVLSVGTCASFGGIPAGNPNPTQITGVGKLTGRPTINIPGCPPHPDWIVWTVANLLAGVMPELDGQSRPIGLFQYDVHKNCPKKGLGETKVFGEDDRCLKELGCKGPRTKADCAVRKWNNGTNWCIGANAVCLGCTESGFPDSFSPFYKVEYGYSEYSKPDQEPPETSNPPEPATALQVTKSEYVAEKKELRVDGKGVGGSIVQVEDADSGAVMGAVSVAADGRWKFRFKEPKPVPQRIKAKSGGETVIVPVKLVSAVDNGFDIAKAEWRADRSELKVEGSGKAGGSVSVYVAATGALLGKATVKLDGKWRVSVKNPAAVPCQVAAASGNQQASRAVKNAPAGCL